MSLPADYVERVYAGVLGKLIGVYLGRPFEQWPHEVILEQLGEIDYYVHEKLDVPLIVTDDDISGTFTFLRALPDYGNSRDVTAAQIGHTWLNYLIEEKTHLWWGGMGNSTEHTAYLRLKSGVEAPASGSMELNGKVVAEQIGSQIFIDGWAMVAPGDPDQAVELAGRAATVSHDGEAKYGAQVIAAMESLAFVESNIDKLIDSALTYIPENSAVATMIREIREWHAQEPDWYKARLLLHESYGYHIYGGNCHMVPNHGLIILSLLYGDDDFQKSLRIVNTAGWDTDCNSGNLGCLLGIKNGLAALDVGPDWRGPVADRMYLPAADGGRVITDALAESYHIVNIGRALEGEEALSPKNGARFHFSLPGSVQGFQVEDTVESRGTATVTNVALDVPEDSRGLSIDYTRLTTGRVARVSTPTFIPSKELGDYFSQRGYKLLASPTIYSGQIIRARVKAAAGNEETANVRLYVRHYDEQDELAILGGDVTEVSAGTSVDLEWKLPNTGGYPIASIGVEISGEGGTSGTVVLDYLDWQGTPEIVLDRPYERDFSRRTRGAGPVMWQHAWVDGTDSNNKKIWPDTYRLLQNHGRGLLMQGTREWTDYQVTTRMTPHMLRTGGIGVRVQGMRSYYALLCDTDRFSLVRTHEGQDTVLAETGPGWVLGQEYEFIVKVEGHRLTALVDGQVILEATDPEARFAGGGIALVAEEGRLGCDHVAVGPIN